MQEEIEVQVPDLSDETQVDIKIQAPLLSEEVALALSSKVDGIIAFLKEDVCQKDQDKDSLYDTFFARMKALQEAVIDAVNTELREHPPQNELEEDPYQRAFQEIFGDKKLAEEPESREFLLTIQAYFRDQFEESKTKKVQTYIDDEGLELCREKLEENIDIARRQHFLSLDFLLDTVFPQTEGKEKEKEANYDFEPIKRYVQDNLFIGAVNLEIIKWYNKLLKSDPGQLMTDWENVIKAYNQLAPDQLVEGTEFLKKLEIFRRRIITNFNLHDQYNDSNVLVAIAEFFKDQGLPLLKLDNAKKDELNLLRSQTAFITAGNPVETRPILDNIVSRVQRELLADVMQSHQQSSILERHISGQIMHLDKSFIFFTILAFEPEDRAELKIPLEFSQTSDDYTQLQDFLIGHENTKNETLNAKEAIRAEVQQTDLRAKQVIARHSSRNNNKALDELQKLEQDLRTPGRLDDVRSSREDQAAFKHKISKKKYTISKEETELLKRATGIEVESLIFEKKKTRTYPASTLTYEEFQYQILNEIEAREAYNSTRYFSISKKSINELRTALNYVEFHRLKLTETLFPELRLNPTAHKDVGELDHDITKVLENTSTIPVKKLVYQKKQGVQYPATTLTYQEYIARVEGEKTSIIAHNQRLSTKAFFWRKCDVDHLDRVLVYMQGLEAHQGDIALVAADSPPQPRPLGPQGRHRDTQKSSKGLRQMIGSWLKSIPFYSSRKKELRTLNTLLIQKTTLAAKLKEMVDPSGNRTKEVKKAERAHKTVSNIEEGRFIESANLTSSATTSIFTKLAVSSELQSLVKLHLDNENLIKDLQDKKTAVISRPKADNFDLSVKYQDSDYNANKSDDVNVLQDNINHLISQLLELPEESSEEEYKTYINQIGLIIKLAKDLDNLLLEKLKNLPIDGYKQVLKMKLAAIHKDLVDRCRMPEGFLVSNERALNQIGEMLTESKQLRTGLKDASIDYLAALDLQLEAKREVITRLEAYKNQDVEIVKAEIQKEIDHLSNYQIKTYKEVQKTNVNDYYAANGKILEMITDLTTILNKLSKGSSIEKIMNKYQSQIITLESDKICETGRVNTLLHSAKEMIHSFANLADHSTDTIEGRHAFQLPTV